MFDEWSTVDLLDEAGEALRCERAAVGRRLLALGRFGLARQAQIKAGSDFWAVDEWDNIAAEIATELGIGRGQAATHMDWGMTLIERFPALGEAMLAGSVDLTVFRVIEKRTELVGDAGWLAALDAQLAVAAPTWNRLSRNKVAELVDWMVIELDPDAVRISTDRRSDRFISIKPGAHGMAELYGRIPALDAAVVEARIEAVAASVCRDDPRTRDQRRADALLAIAAGQEKLGCQCGNAECPAAGCEPATGPGTGAQVVIHVVAEAATTTGQGSTPGYLPGLGAVPAAVIADLCNQPWARLAPVADPTALGCEPGHRPSRKLADFVRCRDLTCRFPGCDQPAYQCDIDHVVPWPAGPTHAGNLACLCRFHHLLKTFYTGDRGWAEQLYSDGTVVWTTPGGHRHVTKPYGAQYFPQLATPVAPVPATGVPPPQPGRGLCMPTRKHTRGHNRATRIANERNANRARRDADPPPF